METSVIIIVLAGFVGTTAMTAFIYACGLLMGKEFSEPKFLSELLDSRQGKSSHNTLGWALHYGIGLVFALGMWGYTVLTHGEPT